MKQLLTTSILALASTPALAHPGAHDHLAGWEGAGEHLLGSPFHQLLLVVAVSGLVLAVSLVRKSKKTTRKQPVERRS
ncbi:hypothetical protein FIV06_20675 [Labrenzia sp. THAF191b]|uniref:hypothetical protein n=1 Tax=unclassified Labrenzia TaxID=2648686 RepID=UPI001267DE57|nr:MULTISPECIES: hypothetical protein [unclassified Labrenzia]QFS99855.1 hypothetical protein FIV06_20675 [Labrenzia sp. THAF191b]QFT06169.1 hypothetical protein FIV05_20670 [Labrenzia sp. THAF191a]QFT17713.1 hypothetical protein FIV03_20685 [Labrenzia sp. THAF187b]